MRSVRNEHRAIVSRNGGDYLMTRKLQFNLIVDVEDGITDSDALEHAIKIVALGQHQARELARLSAGAMADGNERDWHAVPIRLRVVSPGTIMFRVTGISPYPFIDTPGFCAQLRGDDGEIALLPTSMRPDNPCDLMKVVGRTVRAELLNGVFVVNQGFLTGLPETNVFLCTLEGEGA